MAKPIRLIPKEPKGKYVRKFPDRQKSSWNIFELYNKEERKALKEKVIDMYQNQKIKRSEIARSLNVPVEYVGRMIKDPSIPKLSPSKVKEDNLKIEALVGVSFTNETKTMIQTKCVVCDNYLTIPRARFVASYLNKNRITYTHTECYFNNVIESSMANRKKMKSNKTGYIGISIKVNRSSTYVVADIISGRKNLFHKSILITDECLMDQITLDLAILRDEFIIINNLAHTRNFTDDEVLEHMKIKIYEENLSNLKRLKTLEERLK